VEVRVFSVAPRFALTGYAWRSHAETVISGEAVSGIARKGDDGLGTTPLGLLQDKNVVRLYNPQHFLS
jgi:hypothetical protein